MKCIDQIPTSITSNRSTTVTDVARLLTLTLNRGPVAQLRRGGCGGHVAQPSPAQRLNRYSGASCGRKAAMVSSIRARAVFTLASAIPDRTRANDVMASSSF